MSRKDCKLRHRHSRYLQWCAAAVASVGPYSFMRTILSPQSEIHMECEGSITYPSPSQPRLRAHDVAERSKRATPRAPYLRERRQTQIRIGNLEPSCGADGDS